MKRLLLFSYILFAWNHNNLSMERSDEPFQKKEEVSLRQPKTLLKISIHRMVKEIKQLLSEDEVDKAIHMLSQSLSRLPLDVSNQIIEKILKSDEFFLNYLNLDKTVRLLIETVSFELLLQSIASHLQQLETLPDVESDMSDADSKKYRAVIANNHSFEYFLKSLLTTDKLTANQKQKIATLLFEYPKKFTSSPIIADIAHSINNEYNDEERDKLLSMLQILVSSAPKKEIDDTLNYLIFKLITNPLTDLYWEPLKLLFLDNEIAPMLASKLKTGFYDFIEELKTQSTIKDEPILSKNVIALLTLINEFKRNLNKNN